MWYSYGKSRLFAKRSSYEGYEPFDGTVKGLVEGSKSDPSRLSLSYGLVLQRRRVYPRRVEGILRPSNWSFVNTI